MKEDHCPRLWEVQAARDGRLDEPTLASLQSHLVHCRACQHEQQTFRAYLDDMSRIRADVDQVALRRMRHSVLAQANNTLTGSRGVSRLRWLGAGFSVCCAAVVLVVALRGEAPVATVDVTADGAARWQRTLAAQTERIALDEGTLRFRVTHQQGGRRLIVSVPEGEIEDVGTTFEVSVAAGRTVSIVVSDGRVVFHRAGLPDLQLIAGSDWSPPREHVATPRLADAGPLATVSDASVAEAADSMSRDGEPSGLQVSPRRRAHPQAVRSSGEDAAYLRVINLLRGGRQSEARAAAELYLQHFPAGFRRPELERLVRQLAAREVTDP